MPMMLKQIFLQFETYFKPKAENCKLDISQVQLQRKNAKANLRLPRDKKLTNWLFIFLLICQFLSDSVFNLPLISTLLHKDGFNE